MPTCIAGMHRSGTSMVTKLLKMCGLHLGSDGDIMPPGSDNPEGFWENLQFTRINDEVLNIIGAGWDIVSDIPENWEQNPKLVALKKRAIEVIDEFSDLEPWGWKDPRNSLTFPFWRSINSNLKVVICIRNPLDVAESLRKRGNSSLNFSVKLWLNYNRNLLNSLQPGEYIVTHYDAYFHEPQLELERLLDFLQITVSPDLVKNACSTISTAFQHNRTPLEELFYLDSPYKSDVIETYLALCQQAGPVYLSNWHETSVSTSLSEVKDFKEYTQQLELAYLTVTIEKLRRENKSLISAIAERDMNLKSKDNIISSLNATLEDTLNSASWKITMPLRSLTNSPTYIKIKRTSDKFIAWAYHKLPLSENQKIALKDFLFGNFHFLFRSHPQFANWQISRTGPRRILNHQITIKLVDIPEVEYKDRLTSAFSQEPPSNPSTSIIIPVHNQLKYTVRCLLSIAALNDKTSYEIIVIDDYSNDQTQPIISACKGIRFIRNNENLGFLRTCNKAASVARGRFVLLLNNDTVVLPNWLDSLIETFNEFPNTGLVGSKLVYPNNTLQEAGGMIWADGDGWNYGRRDDPSKPQYNYVREVDYCSGASIILPKLIWDEMKGFDEIFCPAYYEDTDLAFRVRQAGYKVLYQPKSQVIHFEGISSGKDINAGIKKFQTVNREKFVSRWTSVLANHGDASIMKAGRAPSRYAKGHILYMDATTPTPNRDSGSVDAYNFMRIFRKLGYEVSFVPASDLSYLEQYTDDLQQRGIECQYQPYVHSIDSYIEQEAARFDIIFLSRFPVAARYIDEIRAKAPGAKIIFNTVDLHFLREEREAQLQGRDGSEAQKTKQLEISIMQKADHTILVSESELELVHKLQPGIRASVVPLPREIPGRLNDYEQRRNIVFLGGYRHQPNVDAVDYFINEIWPLISARLPGVNFLIAGSHMPKSFYKYNRENIILRGFVEDAGELFNDCRLSVAPLRYGAGAKGKIVTSLSYGVPCVASSIAIEGMGLEPNKHILHAATPKDFADSVIKLYSSPELWHKLSEDGLDLVRRKYSLDIVEECLSALLSDLLHSRSVE